MTSSRADWRRWLGGVALIVLLAVFARDLGKVVGTAIAAIAYPYDLDYGEGIVWQQMDDIVAGHGYAPLGTFPAIVFHYPPVYHLTVAAFRAIVGVDPLAAGRLVSAASTLVAMALIAWLVAAVMRGDYPVRDRTSTRIGMIVGAVAFAISPTVIVWAPLMRVDMLATALTLAGLCCAIRELERPARIPGAAILLALAVYTKQTAIIAPVAVAATYWIVDRRAAGRFVLVCGSLGIVALAVLMAATHGEFLRHVLTYNVNRFDPTRWRLLAMTLASQVINLAIAAAVIAGMVHRHRVGGIGWRDRRHAAALLVALYFAARLVTAPLSLKSGASDNYFIDLFSAAAVLVGVATAAVATSVVRGAVWPRALVTLLVLVALPLQAIRLGDAHAAARSTAFRAENDALVARIRAARRPVITDFMVLLKRAGQPVRFEPAIAAELAHSGLYDEAGFVRMIRRGDFAFFLTSGMARTFPFDERYNPQVSAAISAAYPREVDAGEMMILHFPTASPTPAR